MTTIWRRRILPLIVFMVFSIFFILISLLLIRFSWFLRRELEKIINKYERDNVVKILFEGHFKGLIGLFIRSWEDDKKRMNATRVLPA